MKVNFNQDKYYVPGSSRLTEGEKIQFARDLRALELRGVIEYREDSGDS